MDIVIPGAVKRPRGRPIGARSYGGRSHIAREMKIRGIDWRNELIDAYLLYKEHLKGFQEGKNIAPDAELLRFWIDIMPYIETKMIEKETRGAKPKYAYKPRITPSAIAALTKAEGRKPA